jgi:hypothetical protein
VRRTTRQARSAGLFCTSVHAPDACRLFAGVCVCVCMCRCVWCVQLVSGGVHARATHRACLVCVEERPLMTQRASKTHPACGSVHTHVTAADHLATRGSMRAMRQRTCACSQVAGSCWWL